MFCTDYDTLVKTLTSCGYIVHSAKDGHEAVKEAMEIIGDGSVGFGGSVTVKDVGLYEALKAHGNKLFWHWMESPDKRAATCRLAQSADHYVCSTNALTRGGALVNTDGNGNRVAGMFYGPESVIVLIGKNKLAKDIPSAMERINHIAAPLNAKRLGIPAPCVSEGECMDCGMAGRICKVTTIIERPSNCVKAMHLILIDEELGY